MVKYFKMRIEGRIFNPCFMSFFVSDHLKVFTRQLLPPDWHERWKALCLGWYPIEKAQLFLPSPSPLQLLQRGRGGVLGRCSGLSSFILTSVSPTAQLWKYLSPVFPSSYPRIFCLLELLGGERSSAALALFSLPTSCCGGHVSATLPLPQPQC